MVSLRFFFFRQKVKKKVMEFSAKGQFISKCPFAFVVSTKIPTEKFDKFCLTMGRAEFVKFFRWYFGPNDDT